MDPVLKNLVSRLLTRDPEDRLGASVLGANGYEALKSHKFFEGLDFNRLFQIEGPCYLGHMEKRSAFGSEAASSQSFFYLHEEFQDIIPSGSQSARSRDSGNLKSSQSSSSPEKSQKSPESEWEKKPIFSGAVKYTVYMFFARDLKMVLYGNGQVILFRQGVANVPFPFFLLLLNGSQTSFMLKKYTRVFQNHVSKFKVQTIKPPGEYEFEPINKTVAQWIAAMKEIVEKKRRESKNRSTENFKNSSKIQSS